jgi:hypothetical protein
MSVIDLTKKCQHEKCVWLPGFQKFIDIDYVPEFLCNIAYDTHNSFDKNDTKQKREKKKEKKSVAEIFANKFHPFFAKYIENMHQISSWIGNINYDISLKIDEIDNEEENENNNQNFKKILIAAKKEMKNILTIMREMQKTEKIKYNEIIEILENDKQNHHSPIRRQREETDETNSSEVEIYEWYEDITPQKISPVSNFVETYPQSIYDKKAIIFDKSYVINENNLERDNICCHSCRWGFLYRTILEICDDKQKCVSVPTSFCSIFRDISMKLNSNYDFNDFQQEVLS